MIVYQQSVYIVSTLKLFYYIYKLKVLAKSIDKSIDYAINKI